MPFALRKAPKRDLYWVVNKETGKKHSKEPLPKERASAQMRALYAAEGGYEMRGKVQKRKGGRRPPAGSDTDDEDTEMEETEDDRDTEMEETEDERETVAGEEEDEEAAETLVKMKRGGMMMVPNMGVESSAPRGVRGGARFGERQYFM